MLAPASESVFDVAEWFLDTALNDGEYLQPMKMQYLMFLAQGYYAALTKGQRLLTPRQVSLVFQYLGEP